MSEIKKKNSFTLIELLIVIAIIAIIAGAVLVAINPARRLAEANDARRMSEVSSILTAVNTYVVDNKGDVPDCGATGDLPADGIYRWLGNGTAGSFQGGTWLMDSFNDFGLYQTPDSSGNDNYGSCDNGAGYCPAEATEQKFGKALDFDGSVIGSNNMIEVDDSDSLDIENDITLSAWVRLESNDYNGKIIVKPVPSLDNPWELYALDTGSGFTIPGKFPRFIISTGILDEWYGTYDTDYRLSIGEWYLITGVYNGDIMKLYVNGTLITDPQTDMWKYDPDGPIRVQQVNISIATNNQPLRIGAYRIGSRNGAIDGIIDEAAVFDYAMTDGDVQSFYNGGAHIINGAHTCDLTNDLVTTGGYLSSIPIDPMARNDNNSGYLIKRDFSGVVSVKAPYASDYAEQEIKASR